MLIMWLLAFAYEISFWSDFGCYHVKESTISSLKEWLADPAIGNNPTLRLIAGIVFMHEQDYNEALKHTNAGGTLELYVLLLFLLYIIHHH